jgi:hypothetical protein
MPDSAVEPDWPVWLACDDVRSDAKAARLALHVATQGTLPEGCEFLWSEATRVATAGRSQTAVLVQLFQQLDARQLTQLLGRTPKKHVRSLFGGLIVATSQDVSLTAVLSQFVSAVDEDQLGPLLRGLGSLSGLYPAEEPDLGQRLWGMLQQLPEYPERFWTRLATLRAGARFLPGGHDRVRAWRQFQDAFEAFVAACQSKGRGRFGSRIPAEGEIEVRNLGAALAHAMPADWYPDDAQASGKRRLLSALLAQSALAGSALPHNFWQLLGEGLANRPRNLLPCLRLWDADTETTSAVPGAEAVPALLSEGSGREQPRPDDCQLFQFLNAPAGEDPGLPNSPRLPDRWRIMPAEDRRRWFCGALTAYLQTCPREQTALVLLVEPEISSLLAYGIARFLPQPWRSRLRCAAPSDDRAGGPTSTAPSHAPGLVFDTWMDPGSLLPASEGYAELILADRLLASPADAARQGARIDQWLRQWEQAQLPELAQLQELARGEITARRMLAGTYDPSATSWMQSRRAQEHVRRRIRHCLASHPDPAFLDRVAESPILLRLAVDIGLEAGGDVACRAAVRSLVERVAALDSLDDSLGPGPAGRAFKLHALAHYISIHQRLPLECGWLWRERPSVGHGGQQPLLFDLLSLPSVHGELIRASLVGVPAEGLGLLFCGVLTTQAEGPAQLELLARLGARPDLDLPRLLAEFGTDLLIHKDRVQDALAPPLRQLLDGLHLQPQRFPSLPPILETARRLFQGGSEHPDLVPRISAWQELSRVLQAQRERTSQRSRQMSTRFGLRSGTDITLVEDICRCLDLAFPQESHPLLRSRDVASLAAFVVAVAQQEGLAGSLPQGLPKLLGQYFRRGMLGLQDLRKHYEARAAQALLQQSAVVIGVCCALVLLAALGAFICSRGDGSSSGRADPALPNVPASGTGPAPEPSQPGPAVSPPPDQDLSPLDAVPGLLWPGPAGMAVTSRRWPREDGIPFANSILFTLFFWVLAIASLRY